MINYPASADTFPDLSSGEYLGAAGTIGLAQLITDLGNAAEALEAKVGSGATVPAANTLLFGTGPGTSVWGQITSAQLRAAVTDETGSGGSLVFSSGPTLVGPALSVPRIATSINDLNGNELLKLGVVASAVNEITVSNAATGGAPQFAATGDDTDVYARLQGKGAGQFLPQLGIQSAAISNTGTSNAVAATLNFPSVPFATKILLFGFAAAALSSGAPTLSWINWILRGSTTGGVGIASGDNTKSAAAGITESRVTSLMAVESVAANTAQAYVWMVGSTTSTTTSGNFFGMQVAA